MCTPSAPTYLVLPLTFLNTAGSGSGGPKKGTSSLAVTETWKGEQQSLWRPHTSQRPLIHLPVLPHARHRACPLVEDVR